MKWDIMNALLGLIIQMISDHCKEHLYIIVDSTSTAMSYYNERSSHLLSHLLTRC